MKCRLCDVDLKVKSHTTNNGIFGPGYKEWIRYEYHYCPKCGLMYYFEGK